MTSGRVTVNGQVVTELGSKVDPLVDVVAVDGVVCSIAEKPVYLMLNKPAGYLTTMKDPQGRPTILDMVPTEQYPGLFPVGRLDMDTTGLLFFTTDGQMAQELLHPSKHVWKHYVAYVVGTPTEEQLDCLREGIKLEDGPAAPAEVEIVSNDAKMKALLAPQGLGKTGGGETNSLVSVTIREGRKHQVKRCFWLFTIEFLHSTETPLGRSTLQALKKASGDFSQKRKLPLWSALLVESLALLPSCLYMPANNY